MSVPATFGGGVGGRATTFDVPGKEDATSWEYRNEACQVLAGLVAHLLKANR